MLPFSSGVTKSCEIRLTNSAVYECFHRWSSARIFQKIYHFIETNVLKRLLLQCSRISRCVQAQYLVYQIQLNFKTAIYRAQYAINWPAIIVNVLRIQRHFK